MHISKSTSGRMINGLYTNNRTNQALIFTEMVAISRINHILIYPNEPKNRLENRNHLDDTEAERMK
jgi:hypothetical protein